MNFVIFMDKEFTSQTFSAYLKTLPYVYEM